MIQFDIDTVTTAMRDMMGLCLVCGAESEDMVEPDARKYPCSACGENSVYGAEEIMIMGLVG